MLPQWDATEERRELGVVILRKSNLVNFDEFHIDPISRCGYSENLRSIYLSFHENYIFCSLCTG